MCRRFYMLLAGVLILAIRPVSAQDFSCTTNADGVSVTITGYTGFGGDVAIPLTINGLAVTAIGNNALWFNTNIVNLTITNPAISIGSQAFLRTLVLTNVFLGAGVTNVGWAAFAYNGLLLNISVEPLNPDYSSTNGVLFDAAQATLVQCPGGMTGTYAVPGTVTCIGSNAFYYCLAITSVTLPDGVTNIQDSGFSNCGMTNIYLGTNVAVIGANAFFQSGLRSIFLPASVTGIGATPFKFCGGLTNITVDPLDANYSSTNGVLYDKAQTTVIECPGGEPGSLTLPATVTVIGTNAFFGCGSLTNVVFPNGLLTVCDYGLSSANLGHVQLPDTVTSVGNWALFLDNLRSVTFGAGITNIGNAALSDCYYVSTICFTGTHAPALGASAFTSTGSAVFGGAKVYYPLGASGWGAIYGGLQTVAWDPVSQCTCTNIAGNAVITGYLGASNTLVIPGTIDGLPVTGIGGSAFYGNSTLTNVILPAGIKNIDNDAFAYCSGLHSVQLPAALTNIGFGAFAYCSSLTSLTVPAGVTNLSRSGGWEFADCINLKSLYFLGNPPSIGESMFALDTNLTVYYLPGASGWTKYL